MSISQKFDHLPAKVLTLSGYEFFQFIKTTLGEPEADLLNRISVKTTSSFLAVDDPLDIFNYDIEDENLEKLKEKLCFKLKNHKLMIKPGVVSGFRSLKRALEKRLNEGLSKSKKKHHNESSNINSSVLSTLTTTAETAVLKKKLSLSEHKQYVLRLIKKWCTDNKENFNIENFSLEENVDFTLNVDLDSNNYEIASIKCKCGKLISLAKNDHKIQVSNFYKHLQSRGCEHIKDIKRATKKLKSLPQESSKPNELTSTASTALSETYTQLIEVDDDPSNNTSISPPINSQTVSNSTSISPAINSQTASNQDKQNNKRRLTSQSQQHQLTKRSRI